MSPVSPGQGPAAGPGEVRLTDAFDVADLETFVSRARTADPGGAIRLAVHGSVLLVTVRLVPGSGLFGAGGVLGLRAFSVQPADPGESGASQVPPVDVVVAADAVMDRLARMKRSGDLTLAVPPVQVVAPWAGHAPPRSGWDPVARLDVTALRAVADSGIAEIATGAGGPAVGGPSAGALAVDELRRRVWIRPAPDLAGGPAGLAFGAHVLGFLPGTKASGQGQGQGQGQAQEQGQGQAQEQGQADAPVLYRASPWWRLSTPAGHVIAR